MKIIRASIFCCAALLCFALFSGCDNKEHDAVELTPETPQKEPVKVKPDVSKLPLEQRLAIIDGVEREPLKVNRFRWLLQSLDKSCVENQTQIGNFTLVSQSQLSKAGIAVSNLQIMEVVNLALPSGTKHHFIDWAAGYISIRNSGRTDEEARALLPALIAADKAK